MKQSLVKIHLAATWITLHVVLAGYHCDVVANDIHDLSL